MVQILQFAPESEPRTAWADKISATWQKVAESVVETGRLLIEAKADLDHGAWLPMVRGELPFGQSVAERLMKIARNPHLSNPAHAPILPASWTTLYELTKLPDRELELAIKAGLVFPAMQRGAAAALVNAWKSKLPEAVKVDPLAPPELKVIEQPPDPAKAAKALLDRYGPVWFSNFASVVARLADTPPQLPQAEAGPSGHTLH